ncbi:hypothetical protein M3Y99_00080000 [Aphelenchoides fujianensis]|nr:hypothetical protein M3Y99_00080000 [Aphelenchoides fujianensis]
MKLTPVGTEFEAVIFGCLLFLLGGVLSFLCCFTVTHTYLCYKRRVLKRRRHSIDEVSILKGETPLPPTEVVVVERGDGRRLSELKRPSDASFQSGSSLLTSESTGSTSAT